MTNRGTLCARKLLNDCGIVDPSKVSLETFIYARGAMLKVAPIDNSLGRIVFGGYKACITISSHIRQKSKRRFVAAHELGHFEMHKNRSTLLVDNELTLLDWYRSGTHEREANCFAAELLMPTELMLSSCRGQKFSRDLLTELADRFSTSLTATAYKYQDLNLHPIAIILCQNRKIEKYYKPNDFPFTYLPPYGFDVPVDTVAGDFFYKGLKSHDTEVVYASEWFTDYGIDPKVMFQ